MRVVMITTNDPAGTGISFSRALNRYTEHQCRLISTETRYRCGYDDDLHVPRLTDFGELQEVLESADVFHFHMGSDEHQQLGPFTAAEFLAGRLVVHHHHGEPAFRDDPRASAERELSLERRAIVSTPDLLRGYPEATWIPNLVPLDEPAYAPRAGYDHEGDIVVGQSPTRKSLKNTVQFEKIMADLGRCDARLKSLMIDNQTHAECMRLKRTCDIVFDHMQGYFGLSSLEALSMAIPTIAGLDDWNIEHIRTFTGVQQVPWVIARTEDELTGQIVRLASDHALREQIGRDSRAWMERVWNAEMIVAALARFYDRL